MFLALPIRPLGAPANPKVIYSLQVLRAIAALLVVFRHTAKGAVGLRGFEVGQIGVDIFFVISGVVIYTTGRSLTWGAFARRRIARIVPLYWLVLLLTVSAALIPSTGFKSQGGAEFWSAGLAFLFVPAYDAVGKLFPPIIVGWSLNFEMYFYGLCVLSLAIFPKRGFAVGVTAMVLLGMIVGYFCFWDTGSMPLYGPMILLLPISCEFLGGMWLARLRENGVRSSMVINVLLVGFSIVWLTIAPTFHPFDVARPLFWGPPAIAIVWSFMASEVHIPFYKMRYTLLLGDASYALYLFHTLVLTAFFLIIRHSHFDVPMPVQFAAALVGSVIVGVGVHAFIELPLVRFASKLLGITKPAEAQRGMRSADL